MYTVVRLVMMAAAKLTRNPYASGDGLDIARLQLHNIGQDEPLTNSLAFELQ